MELNQITYAAIGALIAGAIMLFSGSKQRTAEGEWSGALQWGYLLLMVGIFGVLSSGLAWSFTAILLLFTVLTGAVWTWSKWGRQNKNSLDNNHFRDYMAGFFPIIGVVFVLRTFIAEPFQIPSSSMRPGLEKGDFILVNKFTYGIRVPVLNNVLIPIGKVARGDVAVFNFPVDTKVNYIKRIVGVPGDIIEYKDKILTVNGIVEHDKSIGEYRYPDDNDNQQTQTAEHFQAAFDGKSFGVLKVEDVPSVDVRTFNAYQNRMNELDFASGLAENCEYSEDGSSFKCHVPEGKYFAMGDNRDNSADSRYWGFVDDRLIVGKAFFIWMNAGNMKRIGNSIQ